jgi:ABC-2 type transport system permease protein
MKKLWLIFLIELKMFLRQKQAMFFTFFFPIFLLVLFIAVWGRMPGYKNFLLPGIIGMVILTDAFHSVGLVVGYYRWQGYFRRIRTTPVKIWFYLVGIIINRAILMLFVSFILLAIGVFVFRIPFKGNLLFFSFTIILGSLLFIVISIPVVSLSGSEERGTLLTNFISYPMLFLSSAFYPLEYLPRPLQIAIRINPFVFLLKVLRNIVNEGQGLRENYIYLLVLLGWCIVFFFLMVFRYSRLKED